VSQVVNIKSRNKKEEIQNKKNVCKNEIMWEKR